MHTACQPPAGFHAGCVGHTPPWADLSLGRTLCNPPRNTVAWGVLWRPSQALPDHPPFVEEALVPTMPKTWFLDLPDLLGTAADFCVWVCKTDSSLYKWSSEPVEFVVICWQANLAIATWLNDLEAIEYWVSLYLCYQHLNFLFCKWESYRKESILNLLSAIYMWARNI